MESPYYFPDMDRLSVAADQAIEERPSPDLAAPRVSLPPLPTIPACTMLRPGDADYAAHVRVYNERAQVAPALFAICATQARSPVSSLGSRRTICRSWSAVAATRMRGSPAAQA